MKTAGLEKQFRVSMIRGSSVASLFSGCFFAMVPVMMTGICDNRVFITYQALGIHLFFKLFILFFGCTGSSLLYTGFL